MKQQCIDLLAALQANTHMTTKQIRDQLGIGHPAGRIEDLRKAGYDIFTRLVDVPTRTPGRTAKVARYTLLTEPKEQEAA